MEGTLVCTCNDGSLLALQDFGVRPTILDRSYAATQLNKSSYHYPENLHQELVSIPLLDKCDGQQSGTGLQSTHKFKFRVTLL
jgi:hypothetical protein